MPFADDPVWLDGLTYSAAEVRRAEAMTMMANGAAAGALGGVRPGDPGLLVSLAGMSISVAAGVAAVPYPGQGVYRAYSATTWTGTVTAAHASLTRIDLVYLRVWDNSVDAAGLAKADVVYLAGSPGAGVAPTPTAPQVYITLASITVPPGSTTPSVQDLRPAAVAPGGIAPGGAVAGYYVGQYRDGSGGLERYDGTTWVPYAQVLSVRKTSDQTITNSATLQTDSQLTLTLAANSSYGLESLVFYSTPPAADLKIGWSIPAGSTIVWSPWGLSGDPASDVGGIRVAAGPSGNTWTLLSALSATTMLAARPVGTIRTGSSGGALTLQWGQAAADLSTTTVYAQSWIRATRLPA